MAWHTLYLDTHRLPLADGGNKRLQFLYSSTILTSGLVITYFCQDSRLFVMYMMYILPIFMKIYKQKTNAHSKGHSQVCNILVTKIEIINHAKQSGSFASATPSLDLTCLLCI